MNERTERTSLYRHFAEDDTLLYVGISLSTVSRLSQHKDDSDWFYNITKITIEHFSTRKEAEKAECIAIKTEYPAHNIRHKKSDATPEYKEINKISDKQRRYLRDYYVPKELEEDFLRIAGVAHYTSLSKSHIYKLIKTDDFPCANNVWGFMLWSKEQIDTWLDRKFKETECSKLQKKNI